jgi:hypothetical protein
VAPVSKVSKTGSKEKEDIRRFPLSQYDLPFDIMTVGCEYTEKVLFFIRLNFPPPLATTIICRFISRQMETASDFDIDLRTLYHTVFDILKDTVH